MVISLKNVKKIYKEASKDIVVFDDLSIDIESGTKNIILGASGCGKSTFLNLISAIDDADLGDILIDGINIAKISEQEKTIYRRENIGFIFQFFNLLPTLSIEENILLPLELNKKLTNENKDFALNLLERVGLIDRLKSFPDRLSGGQQQRIAIVRALAHRPKIIVADEPTGNLDNETASVIMDLIFELINDSKATLLMATHNENFSKFADNTYLVSERGLKMSEVL